MSERGQCQDLVVLFDAGGTAVVREMHWVDFERLRQRVEQLPQRAGETMRAAYVTVEPGLRVGGIAFFLLPLDRDGAVSDSFNVPLRYLVQHAGVRADFGIGPVHVASRAQCPVPWMALNLWEPVAAEDGPVRMIQRAVVLNRLGLSSNPPLPHARIVQPAAADPRAGGNRQDADRVHWVEPDADGGAPVQSPASAARFAASGIEQSYLEQIRKFRSEVLDLKAALRLERARNRRLQALLRGEV